MIYSVAIDGPSGAGKSSMAKRIAKEFGFIYVDTGAIYRTVGLYCLENNIDRRDEHAVEKALPKIAIEMKYDEDGMQIMMMNGRNVSKDIRQPEVSIAASDVSALGACRSYLLEMQRKFARESSVIMDGRDIGTVVLPDADCKIYLTASAETRAERRMIENREKGIDQPYEDVLKDIQYRDYQDTHREVAPLRQADDAILIDSSLMDIEETYEALCGVIREQLCLS